MIFIIFIAFKIIELNICLIKELISKLFWLLLKNKEVKVLIIIKFANSLSCFF